jgi:hypothetical protein
LNVPNAPLFRDPIYDGAADPVIIWNHEANEWWLIYTNRRATVEGKKNAWVHGTDLGTASSSDGDPSSSRVPLSLLEEFLLDDH